MKRSIKKVVKVSLIVAIALAGLILLLALLNVALTAKERATYKAPGTLITLDRRKLHLYTQGTTGKNIVFLPGLGTPSPYYDFSLLANALKDKYRVTIVEPFGYGWSDTTKKARTNANMVEDTRAALDAAGIDPPYILVPHSISGLYALHYANAYPNEIEGVVCLDTSVPGQTILYTKPSPPSLDYGFLRRSGLMRVAMTFFPGLYPKEMTSPSKEETKKILMFCNWNMDNPSVIDELKHMKGNLIALQGKKFPDSIPVRMFLSEQTIASISKAFKDFSWEDAHRALLSANPKSGIDILPGPHYIHHENYAFIAEMIKSTF
jgi:pimeloyl-ACP methyl ester carboxylesterase